MLRSSPGHLAARIPNSGNWAGQVNVTSVQNVPAWGCNFQKLFFFQITSSACFRLTSHHAGLMSTQDLTCPKHTWDSRKARILAAERSPRSHPQLFSLLAPWPLNLSFSLCQVDVIITLAPRNIQWKQWETFDKGCILVTAYIMHTTRDKVSYCDNDDDMKF